MSQYETDRENEAVGPELCDECDHPLRLHGPEGCEFERGDRWVDGESMGAWMAMGPCGCQATTLEAEDEPSWPSPLLRGPDGQKREPLDVSWDELS